MGEVLGLVKDQGMVSVEYELPTFERVLLFEYSYIGVNILLTQK